MLGPSACGKSMLLRIIAGLDQPTEGRVEIEATGGRHAQPTIDCVFQDAHLLPWRTVLENVELPLELRGTSQGAGGEAALKAIEQVGLAEAIDRYPAQLSGGMRMRASLARALVLEPETLLLDEPCRRARRNHATAP